MSTADSLTSVLRYMRRATCRALDAKTCFGQAVEAGEGSENRTIFWVHPAKSDGPKPVVFEIHGGGFALGDPRKEDALCEYVRDTFDVHVVGINYRLAPECPYPAALEDVVDAMARVARGELLSVDPCQFYVLGYSAGANLALSAAMTCYQRSDFHIAGMALHYPFLDANEPANPDTARDIDLPLDLMAAFNEWYVADDEPHNPRISPVFASDDDLAALPVISLRPVVGDSLFGQAKRLNDRLTQVGNPALWHPVEGMYHGYIEDAADVEAYRAVSLLDTVKARPKNFVQEARRQLTESLEEILEARDKTVFA